MKALIAALVCLMVSVPVSIVHRSRIPAHGAVCAPRVGSLVVRSNVALGAQYPVEESFDVAIDAPLHRAYIPSSEYRPDKGRVRIFDTCTGALVKTVSVAPYALLAAVDARRGRVLIVHMSPDGAGPGLVSLLDARSGAVLHTTRVGNSPADAAVDAQTGRAFVLLQNLGLPPPSHGAVSTIDMTSGRVVRTVAVGDLPTQVALDAAHGDLLVANSHSGSLCILDATSGRVVRAIVVSNPHAFAAGPFAVAVDQPAGLAFVAGFSGVRVLRAPYGSSAPVTTSVPPGSNDNLAVDAAHGTVLAGGLDDKIRLIHVGAGYAVRPVTIPRAHGITVRVLDVDAHAGIAFIGSIGPAQGDHTSGPGYVTFLDTRTGRILGAVHAGFKPTAAAVDPQSGLVFVLDTYYNRLTILNDHRLGSAAHP